MSHGKNLLYAHIHARKKDGQYPGVVFVPGGFACGTDCDSAREMTAREMAKAGYVVLHYDPSGRGRTGGEENHWDQCSKRSLRV